MCEDTVLDTFYVPYNPGHSGQMVFTGLMGTVIQYNDDQLRYFKIVIQRFRYIFLDFRWEARKYGANNIETVAFTKAPRASLLGHYPWQFNNDSKKCSLDSKYSKQLTFSGCNDDQFRRRMTP